VSARRTLEVARVDLFHNLRRPIFWIWIAVLVLLTWGMSTGEMRISSGDTTVGGKQAYITSEFANAQILTVIVAVCYGFFIAIGAGMVVIRDRELGIDPVLHSTQLRMSEYVWGKFLGALLTFVLVLVVHLLLAVLFNHQLGGVQNASFVGPLRARHYWRPALLLSLPTILFYAGTSFALGARTKSAILVFFAPLVVLMTFGMLLWNWSPSWLDPRVNRFLMWIDPAGVRWLGETYLDVDRGVDFYNTATVAVDTPFFVSRLVFCALALLCVAYVQRHLARTLRGTSAIRKPSRRERKAARNAAPRTSRVLAAPLAALRMRSRRPGFLRGLSSVLRVELRALRRSPGMYLFIPIILMQTVGNTTLQEGVFETRRLVTSGHFAVGSLGFLTTLTCLLLLFYTVESLRREDACGLGSIYYATPVRSTSVLFGKALANALVGVVMLLATFVTVWVVMQVQGVDGVFDPRPFGIVWGLALTPTFLVWSAFVMLLYSLTGSRYTTYGLALAALAWTGYEALTGDLTWVTNWPLWGALRWSDLGLLELTHEALVLNRALMLLLTVLFVVVAVRLFPRRGVDATRALQRLRPRALLVSTARIAPLALLPLALGAFLHARVQAGFQGDAAEQRAKDYWRRYEATWRGARIPDIAGVNVETELFPDEGAFTVRGHFDLAQREDEQLPRFPITFNPQWTAIEDPERGVEWTLDGAPYEPRVVREALERARRAGDQSPEPPDLLGLIVIERDAPLARGDTLRVGFAYRGAWPYGDTKNGGGDMQFVLPSGVVLHSFGPSWVPVVGFMEGVGVDEDNRSDAKEYPAGFHTGVTRSGWGSGAPFPVRSTIIGPATFTMNGNGRVVDEELLDGGRKRVVWETDHPVRIFNLVASPCWVVTRGAGTAIYHAPEHSYNVDEMLVALDAARRCYSAWFMPYPWEELKLSEFPAHADYAQGFATNITFSESIGFLTNSDDESNAAFLVTAHEAAHQWWGNLLTPGELPGGSLLSEGMAHFSTLLLFEEVHGLAARIRFAKQIEDRYGNARRADAERPLVMLDGSHPGDQTVTYDKGGFVFWMLLNHMGRERCLAGLQSFIRHYQDNRDHPQLQDLVEHLRPFAPDPDGYDAFTRQWFFDVVVPELELLDVTREDAPGDGTLVRGTLHNEGTGLVTVDVCAARGARFTDDGEPADEFQEARVQVTLGAGGREPFELSLPFEPTEVVVDPDALVLQLNRGRARHAF
jgi:ABC-type transport system involved in multi-copper enzyme maturation permease subunit